MSVVGGKLKFKGNFQKKLDEEYKKRLKKLEEQDVDDPEEEKILSAPKEKKMEKIEFEPTPATGRILTSGKTIHGKDTKFTKELKQGDFIVITHPSTFVKEEREVSVVLSDKSASVLTPFTSDLITFTPFEIRKKPEFREVEDSLEENFEKKLSKVSKKIQKPETYLEYREKTGMWGYRTVKEKVSSDLTREELLDLRAKKNRDKFCWI